MSSSPPMRKQRVIDPRLKVFFKVFWFRDLALARFQLLIGSLSLLDFKVGEKEFLLLGTEV